MSEEDKIDKLVFAVSDFATAIESAVVGLRQNIKEISKIPEEKPAQVYNRLPWEDRKGSRGPFQRVNKKVCNNSDLYRHLFNIVKVNTVNTGKFGHSIGNYVYWLDTRDKATDSTAIFRRRKKGKPPQEAEKESSAIEAIKALFPKDLEDLLSFELTEKYVVAKPQKFLGSEDFAKIASIVHEANGEYISAGKESHFRFPLNA